jgi:hypothetical protein
MLAVLVSYVTGIANIFRLVGHESATDHALDQLPVTLISEST